MKHKLTIIIMALAGVVVALATQAKATTITYSFQENGPGNLGSTSTFTESGFSLTANGFLNNGSATDLFAKSSGPGETGLGTAIDGDHEINTTDFVQLTLPTSPPANFQLILLASVQSGESADIYFSNSLGALGAKIGTITSDGSFTVSSSFQKGFIGITAGSGNVLLAGAQINTTVPDGGSALALLGIALAGIEGLRRSLRTK